MTERHPMFAGSRTMTPYGGASAPGGSSGSREADAENISSGRLSALYMTAIARLRNAGPVGLTWGELGELENLHHGRATSLLSNMHREGYAVRLAKKREGTHSSIYVLPEFVEDRPVARYKGSKASAALKAQDENEARIKELETQLNWFREKNAADEDEKAKLAEEIRRLETTLRETEAERDALEEERQAWEQRFRGALSEAYEADQALGKALGYPEAYPAVSPVDDGSVVTGEHTLPSLAAEAARKINDLRTLLETEREAAAAARPVIPTLDADEAAFLAKVTKAVQGKPDTAVQPTRAGTLRALVALAEKMPRA